MTGSRHGDDSRDAAQEASLRLEPEDVLEDVSDQDVLELGYSPQDRLWAVDDPAVSGERETLDQRLAEEQPDADESDDGEADGDGLGDVRGTDGEPRDREVGDRRAGRLAETDAGSESEPDPDRGLEAFDEGIDGGAASAEEAAVHAVDGG